ncbi:MAG: DUF4215 domain-containing protein [Actinomycetota bacterium]|nr:DUF4215 domain-containing protein [Actinomycetota bacterium]
MLRAVLPLMCVTLSACGLERDLAAWQDLGMTHADSGTSGTSSTSAGSTSGSSSSGSTTVACPETGTSTEESTGSSSTTETSSVETGETTGPPAVCGDGVVAGEEECDDPGDTACFNCIRDRLVFVTSMFDFRGDFSAAPQSLDYWCNHLAAKAGLLPDSKGRFKPWISTSEGSAAERLDHSKGRYVLRNGLVFALSWDALVAGEILNPLNVDEKGETRNVGVWTDTRPDGSALPGSHCEDWTSDSLQLYASFGESTKLDGSWTLSVGEATNPTLCGLYFAIYCFESP